jgi:hypothetical protein
MAGTINSGKYHGFDEYFKNTRADPTAPVYTNRADQAKYQAEKSPKIRSILLWYSGRGAVSPRRRSDPA